MLSTLLRRIKLGLKRSHAVAKEIPRESYWTDHNVTSHKSFGSARESLDYFHWRNDQYIDYIELLPVTGHDGEVIVDFGCGPGHDLVGFHAYSKPKRVYGIDVSSSSLAQARQRLALHDFAVDLLEIYEADGFIPLEGVIDRDAELKRQRKELEKLRGIIAGSEKKLADEKFVSRAPAEVVAQARENLAALHKQLQSVEEIIQQLSAD